MSEAATKVGAVSEPDPKRVAYFRAFLRCGGSITLTEWRGLSQEDLVALNDAAARVYAERTAPLRAPDATEAVDPLEKAARDALAQAGA